LFLTDVIRSLPVLILILWVYYFVPVFIGMPDMNSFSLAAIALTINLAAFIADVVRARIISFPNGLIDAAYACGLSKFSTFVHIMLPEIIREILPTLSLLYIDILKLSSLASVIGVYELVHTADKVRCDASTHRGAAKYCCSDHASWSRRTAATANGAHIMYQLLV
jgi:polar amino acid transport system permease protein